jgi:hypothetical protein
MAQAKPSFIETVQEAIVRERFGGAFEQGFAQHARKIALRGIQAT